MRVWKVLSSTLLILLGFTAGIALRTTPNTVSAADPTPPAALKIVAHDSTLNGDGTAAAPLGLANGAVNVAKLSPSRLPSTGQVLGFDGAGLAWQNAASGGVHLIDSQGKDVGPFIFSLTGVLVQLSGRTFRIGASPSGFPDPQSLSVFLHLTTDCSGPRYLRAYSSGVPEFVGQSWNTATQITYAAAPIQQATFQSTESMPAQDLNQPGACHQVTFTGLAGPAVVTSLWNVGVPPFHLQF